MLAGFVGANAQSFSVDKDTSKGYWASGAGDVELHVKVTNTSSNPIKFDWKITNLHTDALWTFESLCDNVLCYPNTTTGLANGMSSFTTDLFSPSNYVDMKIAFNGNAAAINTKSYATIEMKEGLDIKYATYVAYKNTTSVSNVILQDNDIAIYPNPAQNYIDVVYSPSSDVKSIAIYNLIGKVVSVYKVTNKNSARCEFNTDMPSGIYVIRVADSKGNVIATRKITRQ